MLKYITLSNKKSADATTMFYWSIKTDALGFLPSSLLNL